MSANTIIYTKEKSTRQEKHCLWCKKLLTGKYQKKFCSLSCGSFYQNANKKPIIKPDRFCMGCETILASKEQKKFCSRKCSAKHHNIHNKKPKKFYKNCKTCGNAMYGYKSNNKTYCSKTCRENSKMSKEEKLRKRRHYWQKYKARKISNTPDKVDMEAVKVFYDNCPKGYEVDHILAISKGGWHCIGNLQYLPMTTNRQKKAKIFCTKALENPKLFWCPKINENNS